LLMIFCSESSHSAVGSRSHKFQTASSKDASFPFCKWEPRLSPMPYTSAVQVSILAARELAPPPVPPTRSNNLYAPGEMLASLLRTRSIPTCPAGDSFATYPVPGSDAVGVAYTSVPTLNTVFVGTECSTHRSGMAKGLRQSAALAGSTRADAVAFTPWPLANDPAAVGDWRPSSGPKNVGSIHDGP